MGSSWRPALALACALAAAVPVGAQNAGAGAPARPGQAEELPRKILAFYSKKGVAGDFKDIYYTQLHQRAELPLNYLGMELVYRDADEPLPALASLRGYRGVLTWFEKPLNLKDPEPLCSWLAAAADAGFKIVMLGDPGVYLPGKPARLPEACRRLFRRLGAELGETVAEPDPLYLSVVRKDPAMVESERRLTTDEIPHLPLLTPLAGATSYLTIRFDSVPPSVTDPVLLTPAGGLALSPFLVYENEQLKPAQFRWRVDPFAFLEAAFALKGWPRPDPTTINGRRIYFSHIDGDGFFNVSEIDKKSWSGEVFLKEFLAAKPDWPFTASVITGYYDMPRFSRPEAFELSRRVLNLPNVEPASHGYAHPLIWHRETLALKIPGYTYSAAKEILDSTDFVNRRLLDKGRRANLFLWTGNAVPREGELRLPEEKGLININGGPTRFDKFYPSVGFVFPLSRRLGDLRQIYCGIINENEYTDLWHGPYYGYRDVVETFEKTGSPRRLKPVDVYVHFYSAEKIASVKALRGVYDWAASQPLFPLYAGQYAEIARQFFEMKVSRLGPDRWRFDGAPLERTVRWDGEPRDPDLSLSRGVVGFSRAGGSLFVSFDESEEREIAFSAKPPLLPYLAEANFDVSDFRRDGGGLAFLRSGWWKGELVLGGLVPGREYRVSSAGSELKGRAGPDGRLTARFPDSELGGPGRQVRVEPL